jgi:NTP pyrophosphatase (non-canonical NTP hydrolase)
MQGELADKVAKVGAIYAERFGIARSDDWFLIKLQEELGELAQAHLRLSARGRGTAVETDRANEAADVFCQLLLYCQHFGIDLEQAVRRKWLAYLPEAETVAEAPAEVAA